MASLRVVGPIDRQFKLDAGAECIIGRAESCEVLIPIKAASKRHAKIARNGDHYTIGCSTPAAVSGYPHVTVPGGQVHGLPVGVSFFSTALTEGKLIRYAYAFEQATRARRAPTYPPTLKIL